MKLSPFLLVTFITLCCITCRDSGQVTDTNSTNGPGKILMSIDNAPPEIILVTARLSRPGFEDRVLNLSIPDSERSASGTITNVSVGTWHLRVDALDSSNVVRYSGQTNVEVRGGETTHVELELLPTSGVIEIHVRWGITPCTPIPNGVVSWWRAEGDAHDAVGGNNGELENGVAFVPGRVGQAFSFDGVNDRINVPDYENLRITGSLSIEAWIYIRSISPHTGEILIRADDRLGLDPYYLRAEPNNYLKFHLESLTNYVDLLTPISFNRFIHVAATFDSTNGRMKLYVDGTVAAETTTTVKPFRDLNPQYGPFVGIGNHGGYYHNHPFDGIIDELSLYRRALTAEEIRLIYNASHAGKCRN